MYSIAYLFIYQYVYPASLEFALQQSRPSSFNRISPLKRQYASSFVYSLRSFCMDSTTRVTFVGDMEKWPGQRGHNFTDDTFKRIFWMKTFDFETIHLINISLEVWLLHQGFHDNILNNALSHLRVRIALTFLLPSSDFCSIASANNIPWRFIL